MLKKFLILSPMVLLVILSFTIPVYALSGMSQINNVPNLGSFTNAGNQILGIIYVVGMIIAVGTLMIIGIKYMISSPDDRASIKARAIPYVIGATIMFAAVNIVKIMETLGKQLN